MIQRIPNWLPAKSMNRLAVASTLELHEPDTTYHKVFQNVWQHTRMLDCVHLPDRFRMLRVGKHNTMVWISTHDNCKRGRVPAFHLFIGGEPLRVRLLKRRVVYNLNQTSRNPIVGIAPGSQIQPFRQRGGGLRLTWHTEV